MTTPKPTNPKPKPPRDPLPAILKDIFDNALSLRNGLQQIMGTVVKDSPGDDTDRRLHRLASVTGRTRWFIRTSTAFLRGVQSLRSHLDTIG